MNKKVIDIKIYEDDLADIEMIILEHIRKLKERINEQNTNEEVKEIISKTISHDKMLLEKLSICKLYNEQ